MRSNEEKQVIEKRIKRSANTQRAFKGASGEAALKAIDDFTGYRNDTFDPDPNISAYNAGKRAVAIFLHNILDQDVENAREQLKKENEDA